MKTEDITSAARAMAERCYPNDGDPGTEPFDVMADREAFVRGAEWATARPARVPPIDLIPAIVREVDAEAESYRAVAAGSDDGEPLTVASGSDFADVIAQRIYRLLAGAPSVSRERVQVAWHDATCPEGAECRDRLLHAISPAIVQAAVLPTLAALGIEATP